ncbi:SH3 domain-containing protein [Streptantibioticus ferralitis]|uniref:SH3 domain-containing protein n=1 Tax=Streptantibioticus ferralitis TaxID=236510 RepID=A0ABT5YYV5_9ACTN|nr:SH3 domain-containing protein [Streptantibioticus ferralitis]MDF2256629.1 SH3 domain-containing protein [Streptantibioticus ferralitis]
MMKRHSIRRSVTAALLTAGVAVGTLTTAAGAQALTPAHYGRWHHHVEGRVVSPEPLTVHYGPGVNRWVTGTISNGMHVWIVCKAEGSRVGANDRWYKLADGQGWVPAHYVNNYRYVRWCTR